MKTHTVLLLLAFTSSALAQGPLTPPPGADPSIGPVNALTAGGEPQATMKTLHQIEPRTAIAGSTSSVTLNQSGAYYLTGNITVASGDGIVIAASGVNLDLNGFSIMATAAAGSGISFGAVKNIVIRNGNIGGGFAGGIRYVSPGPFAQRPLNVRVADLTVSDVTEAGISIYSRETNSHIERCMVSGTGGNVAIVGIIGTVIKDCSVQGAGIIGRVVKDCSVAAAPDAGIVADVAENCYSAATGTAITAKCLVNSYGTGGGSSDTISAGVAQNVWAEGGGSGDGVHATVVGNSYGNASTGIGINADVAANTSAQSMGTAIQAKALANAHGTGGGDHDVVSTGLAQNVWAEGGGGSGDAIHGSVVGNSFGRRSRNGSGPATGDGIDSVVVTASFGGGERSTGIRSLNGVTAMSVGSGIDGFQNDKAYGIVADEGVVFGSRGSSSGQTGRGISAEGSSLVASSMGRNQLVVGWEDIYDGGIVARSGGHVVDSFGRAENLATNLSKNGVDASSVLASRGEGGSFAFGIRAETYANSCFGKIISLGGGGTTVQAPLKIDSN